MLTPRRATSSAHRHDHRWIRVKEAGGAGDIDYILKVRVPNARAYDTFYQALIKEVSIFNVTSSLSMEEIKATTALPLA